MPFVLSKSAYQPLGRLLNQMSSDVSRRDGCHLQTLTQACFQHAVKGRSGVCSPFLTDCLRLLESKNPEANIQKLVRLNCLLLEHVCLRAFSSHNLEAKTDHCSWQLLESIPHHTSTDQHHHHSNLTMRPPLHILAAAGYFWCFLISPSLHHTTKRPRLTPIAQRIDRQLLVRSHCRALIRISPDELKQLCTLLFVNVDAAARLSNWRYSQFHRVIIALYCLSNVQTLRKASFTWGWSLASLQHNLHSFVNLVIHHLGSATSGTCSPICMSATRNCSSHTTDPRISVAYRIDGWTYDEQQQWMQNPFGPADFVDCIGIVDGVYFRVERPKDAKLERRLYSTYKKYHSVFFLVIIDRRGLLHSM